jgi:hypothetical protein
MSKEEPQKSHSVKDARMTFCNEFWEISDTNSHRDFLRQKI